MGTSESCLVCFIVRSILWTELLLHRFCFLQVKSVSTIVSCQCCWQWEPVQVVVTTGRLGVFVYYSFQLEPSAGDSHVFRNPSIINWFQCKIMAGAGPGLLQHVNLQAIASPFVWHHSIHWLISQHLFNNCGRLKQLIMVLHQKHDRFSTVCSSSWLLLWLLRRMLNVNLLAFLAFSSESSMMLESITLPFNLWSNEGVSYRMHL